MRLHRTAALASLALAGAVLAQDAAKVSPRTYKVVFEDNRVRVLEYVSKPGLGVCGQGRHYHPAHLTMQLTDVRVKVTQDDGSSKTADVPAGRMFASPAEWHTTENIGAAGARAYIVEYKDKGWRPSTG